MGRATSSWSSSTGKISGTFSGERSPSLPIARAPSCFSAVERLSATHAKGIVHRDIKPENIFLIKRDGVDDFVKIVDFGIAKMSDIETEGAPGRKLTKTGMIFGTPEYMSPEQAAGKDLDHRVDVYALGIILYECLAGRVPFEGDTFMGVLTQHLFAELPPIEEMNPNAKVSRELELVIRKALAKDPDDRYQDTEELAEAVTCALDGRLSRATVKTPPSAFGPPSLSYLAPVPRRKTSRWVWATAASAGVAALAWVALGPVAGQWSEADASEAPAETSSPAVEVVEATEPLLADADSTLTFVNVHVATDPSGARVMLADGSEACAASPCTLEAERGSTLVIRAKLGKRRGRTAITPTQEETVLIELQAPKKSPPKSRKAEAPTRKREKPARSSDLKVPEWAQ